MNSFFATAVAVLPLLVTAPEALCADPPAKKEPWICTVTRADSEGKVLSRASIPLSYWVEGQSCHGTVSFNLGTAEEPRLWDLNFWGGQGKQRAIMNFSVSDSTLLWSSISDGSSTGGSLGVMETSTEWNGAGRYKVFTLDGETVTAEFRPEAPAEIALEEHRPAKIIEITRKDRAGKVTGRVSTTWNEEPDYKIYADLALHGSPESRGCMRIIRARFDETEQAIAFRVRDVIHCGPGPVYRSVVVFDVWAQVNDSGRYRIYSLDGETLEAEIRSGGKAGEAPPVSE